jgi:hypothetical protein
MRHQTRDGSDDRAGGDGFGSGRVGLGGGAAAQRAVRPHGVVVAAEPVQLALQPGHRGGGWLRSQPFLEGLVEPLQEVSLAPLSSGEGKAGGLVVEQGLKDGIGEAALEYAKCLASAVSTALAPFDHLFGRRMPTGLGECDAV